MERDSVERAVQHNDATTDPLVRHLAAIVGGDHVLVDPDVRAGYEVDWTGRWRGAARCVVRPADTAQVALVVRACADAGVAIVTQGGNTGLVGGAVPAATGPAPVVLSTRRLTQVGPVDVAASQVTAAAGVTIADLQAHAHQAGLDFGVDWGARDSATVGGAVATNAGGSRVVRFGTMRQQVMGIEAVFADGSVLCDLGGLPKATLGPHLPSLLTGTEGTLAIVTAARLRLVPLYQQVAAAWLVVPTVGDAVRLLPRLRTLPSLDAVEIVLPEAVAVVEAEFALRPPVPAASGVAVLVECAATADPTDDLVTLVGELGSQDTLGGVLTAGVIAATPQQRRHLAAIRDHVTMAINRVGVPLKLDVAVPVEHLDAVVGEAGDTVATLAPDARLYAFGHLAEGNLHLNVVGSGDAAPAITERVLQWVIDHHGTISAEHGIGRAKAHWLARARGEVATAALQAIKSALDPLGLLNPGVLYPGVPDRP